ncbi:MAG TPA: kelch repeat-containing protein [Flavobacteriales bacterium]|nr:kelch repeat-containing protein [Flavobacteriales bacterium]
MADHTNPKPMDLNPYMLKLARPLTLASVSLLMATSAYAQADSWHAKANLGNAPAAEPTARYGAAGFAVGGKGYIGTGNDGGLRKDLWEYDPVANAWGQKADFGGSGREYAVAFAIGAKGYLGTGNATTGYKKDFWEYDPGTNTWAPVADFGGVARARAVGFPIGTKGYVGTGWDGTQLKDFWEYDPATDTWTNKADFGGTARSFATGFGLDGLGYVGTGNDGANKKDFWAYDPGTDTWAAKTDFGGIARNGAAAFATTTLGYIGTGFGGGNYLADLWAYDPGTDTWTQKANHAGGARSGAVAFSIGAMGYMSTGWNGDVMNDHWAYDPSTNQWSGREVFGGIGRGYAVSFSIGAKGYVGAGWNGAFKKDFWEYDPATDTWSQKADFAGAARSGAVAFSIGTKGYVGTGWAGAYKKDFWEYDPATNAWTAKADFGGAARYAATGFAIGDKGYIGTGWTGSYRKDFWEYNPATDTWTQKADFGGVARYNAAAFSIHTKGYIGTGFSGSNRKDFWMYDPATNTWTQKADFGGTARNGSFGYATGSTGYFGGGNDGAYKKDFWAYDPATNTWAAKSNFGGSGRAFATAFAIGTTGYAGTGRDGASKNDLWSYTPTGPCTGDRVVVRIATDAAPGQITWEITDASNAVIASGALGAAQSNTMVAEQACLNAAATSACYGFRLHDSYGDGITNGGWELRTTTGKLILRDNFSNGSVSPSASPASAAYGDTHSFCLPLGPADIAANECNIFDNLLGNKVYCNKVTGAANYQFEFSDPDAGFIRRIARPHNYVAFGDMVTNPLTPGVKYFARVRTDKDGPMAGAHWGSGCEMGISTQVLGCSGLIQAPAYGHSCNETRSFNTNNSFIYAKPVQGGTEYQFRIYNIAEGYDETFTRNTYILQLKWNSNVAPPLVNGYVYQVEVNVKVNGVWSGFCAASTCSITIDNPASRMAGETMGGAMLWPNPVQDGQVHIEIQELPDMDQHIAVDIRDVYGKQVYGQEFGHGGGPFQAVLHLPEGLASGMYMVNVTANGQSMVQRLSVVR